MVIRIKTRRNTANWRTLQNYEGSLWFRREQTWTSLLECSDDRAGREGSLVPKWRKLNDRLRNMDLVPGAKKVTCESSWTGEGHERSIWWQWAVTAMRECQQPGSQAVPMCHRGHLRERLQRSSRQVHKGRQTGPFFMVKWSLLW